MKIYLSGIGGIGMSALARFFLAQNIKVLGSDIAPSSLLEELKQEGAQIFTTQVGNNIPLNTDLLIFSEALDKNNPERKFAQKNNILQKTYFQYLGELSKNYYTIAIAGTHGKSTTAAMTGLALQKAELYPTVFLGTKVFQWQNKNFLSGKENNFLKQKILVVEACEYRNSFLHLHPDIAVITSLEEEHLDFFKNKENYFKSFVNFAQKAKILIADFSQKNIQQTFKNFTGQKFNSSKEIKNVPKLQVPGFFNTENASLVLSLFKSLSLKKEIAQNCLQNFTGTWRRLEKKGEKKGILVFDDYAHHPTEIKVTLKALKEKFPSKRIFVVFQPHQFSRTKHFLKDFGKSFTNAFKIFVPNIYRVRDSQKDVQSVSAKELVKEINNYRGNAIFSENFSQTTALLKEQTKKNDLIITMGAGPVDQVAEMFLD